MKKFLLTTIAVSGLFAAPVFAADLPARPVYRPAPPPVVFNWTGCYIGGQVGGQWGKWTADVNYFDPGIPVVADASREFDSKGTFIGGGQIGCNYQPIGSTFVFGVEGDLIAAKNNFSGEVFRFTAAPTDHFDATGKIGNQGSLRLRLGAAWDRLLVYVAGGATWAKLDASHAVVRDGVGAAVFDSNINKNGWNLGVGFEYAFAGNWTAGLEYRYTSYGSSDYAIPGGAFPAAFVTHTASADNIHTNDFRIRLNYLFGGGRYY